LVFSDFQTPEFFRCLERRGKAAAFSYSAPPKSSLSFVEYGGSRFVRLLPVFDGARRVCCCVLSGPEPLSFGTRITAPHAGHFIFLPAVDAGQANVLSQPEHATLIFSLIEILSVASGGTVNVCVFFSEDSARFW